MPANKHQRDSSLYARGVSWIKVESSAFVSVLAVIGADTNGSVDLRNTLVAFPQHNLSLFVVTPDIGLLSALYDAGQVGVLHELHEFMRPLPMPEWTFDAALLMVDTFGDTPVADSLLHELGRVIRPRGALLALSTDPVRVWSIDDSIHRLGFSTSAREAAGIVRADWFEEGLRSDAG